MIFLCVLTRNITRSIWKEIPIFMTIIILCSTVYYIYIYLFTKLSVIGLNVKDKRKDKNNNYRTTSKYSLYFNFDKNILTRHDVSNHRYGR